MEDLTPPVLAAVRAVLWRISSGKSMNEAMRLYFETANSPFSHQLREWWALKNQGRAAENQSVAFKSYYQKAFVHLIERGCEGQPTLDPLRALEDELEKAAASELDLFVSVLPFKVLIPMLLFQFPAYLLLLLGPVLRELSHELGTR
jgi:hypothetical protein